MVKAVDDEPRIPHAIILVPGVAGSELVDPQTKQPVWGLTPRLAVRTLVTGSIFDQLRREDLEPGDLLTVRSFLPGLGRVDPYTALATALRRDLCRDPAAFATYPYDWRKPLDETAKGLAEAASEHLANWRKHVKGSQEAKVCLVAHSMGGLLSRCAVNTDIGLDKEDVSMILTLGTPFGGSLKALRAMGHGDILPLKRHASQVRSLIGNMASFHDLLPSYRCLTSDPFAPGAEVPTVDDLVSAGANREMALAAVDRRITVEAAVKGGSEARLVTLMGTRQPTHQSFTLNAGELVLHKRIDGENWAGDGAVYSGAAYPKGHDPAQPLPQQHGPLAKSPEGIEWVKATIRHRVLGPPRGDGIGLEAPDAALKGETIPLRIEGGGLGGITVEVRDENQRRLPRVTLHPDGEYDYIGHVRIDRPGLYEITAAGGGFSPVISDILVLDGDMA